MTAFIKQRYEAEVPLDRLVPHPANPNDGDVGLLCDLFDANGFGGAVLAQESTGILIDGETRLHAAEAQDLPFLPVIWLDVDDDTRDRLLAEYNESTRRGRNDEQKLLDLLTGLAATPRGLAGTAFDGDDMDDLVNRLTGAYGSNPGDGDVDKAAAALERAGWPVIHLAVPRATRDRWDALMGAQAGEDHERLAAVLALAERVADGSDAEA